HVELQIRDPVHKLDIGVRDVPGQFPRRARVRLWPVISFSLWDGSQDLLGSFNFTGKAIKHHGAIAQGKFRGGSRHSSSPSGWELTKRTRSPAIRRDPL